MEKTLQTLEKSIHLTMRLKPKSFVVLQAISNRSGVSKGHVINDMLAMINTISQDPEKLKELVGPIFYEKYFKE